MTDHHDAECQLLEEGLSSYVPAVSAIVAFRELVQSRFSNLVKQHLAEYSAALGVALDAGQIRDYEKPAASKWHGEWATLGIEINTEVWLSHVLSWELGKEGNMNTRILARIWLPKYEQVDRLWKAFSPHPPNLQRLDQEKEIWLVEEVSRAEIACFDQKINDVLRRWIELWRQAGGLKVLALGDQS